MLDAFLVDGAPVGRIIIHTINSKQVEWGDSRLIIPVIGGHKRMSIFFVIDDN